MKKLIIISLLFACGHAETKQDDQRQQGAVIAEPAKVFNAEGGQSATIIIHAQNGNDTINTDSSQYKLMKYAPK